MQGHRVTYMARCSAGRSLLSGVAQGLCLPPRLFVSSLFLISFVFLLLLLRRSFSYVWCFSNLLSSFYCCFFVPSRMFVFLIFCFPCTAASSFLLVCLVFLFTLYPIFSLQNISLVHVPTFSWRVSPSVRGAKEC